MQISYIHCKNILDTLPVGYYLGHSVTVTLDETGTKTYMKPEDESITISYPMIAEALQPAPDTCDPEKLIRGLLYHEISHALLTTKDLPEIYTLDWIRIALDDLPPHISNDLISHLHEYVNIMEDERIETVLARYYLNVDFKENILAINNIADPVKEAANAKNPRDKFFFAVRYHIGPQKILDEIKYCITDYATISNNIPHIAGIAILSEGPGFKWFNYVKTIIKIAVQFFENNIEQNKMAQSDSSEQSDNGEQAGTNSKESQPDNTMQPMDDFTNQILDVLEAQGWTQERLKAILKSVSSNNGARAIEDRIGRIINIATKKHAQSVGTSAAYCGKINPRFCSNKDYKWWLKKSDSDTNKRYSKVHFNLFCDNSCSFKPSQNKMNGLLLALKYLEEDNKNFTFDVVHLGVGDQYKSKKDMYLDTDEGSQFKNTIFDTYKKLQLPNATNLNIVVIDGDMPSLSENGFNAFNHENCIIVTDTDNHKYIKNGHKAKCVFLKDNYADKFIDVVLNKIQACLA